MINVDRGLLWKVAEEAIKVKGVKIAHAVTGQWDVIAYVEFERIDGLSDMIHEIQAIDGVIRTSTSVVMAPRIY
jgi:DNA-binding Lrp family transcriptional regulator